MTQNSVAIVTAVRTWWKDTPLMHVHDEWYMCKYFLYLFFNSISFST